VSIYASDFESDPRLGARTKVVRRNAIAAVRRTWPEVFARQSQQISHEDLKRFLRAYENGKGRWTPPGAKKSVPGTSPTSINGIIKLFTEVSRLGLAEAALFGRNPADDLPRKGYTKRLLQLPSRTQFYALVEAIRGIASNLPPTSADAALLVTLSPGVYTGQVSSPNSSSGAALLKMYEIPRAQPRAPPNSVCPGSGA